MLDPIKVSVVTPGVNADGSLADWGIPASVLTSYLDNKGIIVEKDHRFYDSVSVFDGRYQRQMGHAAERVV